MAIRKEVLANFTTDEKLDIIIEKLEKLDIEKLNQFLEIMEAFGNSPMGQMMAKRVGATNG